MEEQRENELCSDEWELSPDEHQNLVAFWQGVALVMHDQEEAATDIPIGDEYCWMHYPGGWCCPTCYYQSLSWYQWIVLRWRRYVRSLYSTAMKAFL